MTQARSRKHKTVRVNFRAVCSETKWGDTLVVVGSSIGGWSPSSGLRMVTDGSLYPEWNCAAAIELSVRDGSRGTPGGYATEYKLVILRADGSEEWEPLDGNRRIDVGGSAESVRVASTWGRAAGPHDTTVLGPAEQVLDLMLTTLGPGIYNQAVQDVRAHMQSKLDDLDGEVYVDDQT